jgi:hypothetical protein
MYCESACGPTLMKPRFLRRLADESRPGHEAFGRPFGAHAGPARE